MFVPMAADAWGKWGSEMYKVFDTVVEIKTEACPELVKEVKKTMRYAVEGISIGIVKAIGAYMDIVRYGKNESELSTVV